MSEKHKPTDAKVKNPPDGGVLLSEVIPSVAGGVSALASANAPFILFDEVGSHGHYGGIAHISLETVRFMGVDGECRTDKVVTAHLRMNMAALQALKNAISAIELLAQTGSTSRN